MQTNRWFNWVIIAVLVALLALTIRQVAVSAQVAAVNASLAAVQTCPFTPEQMRSIHAQTIDDKGHSLPFTSAGPMGQDGGLYMLRYCTMP